MSKKKADSSKQVAGRKSSKKPSKEVLELQQQLGELTEDLQRIQADFINYKKRVDEDNDRRHLLAQRQLIAVLLPTFDNIERALGHLPEELNDNSWAQGVQSTSEQLFESLERLGVERIKTVGESFNPEFMEAVQVDDGEGEHEIVSEELQSGYKMKDELIRPAMVKVRRQE